MVSSQVTTPDDKFFVIRHFWREFFSFIDLLFPAVFLGIIILLNQEFPSPTSAFIIQKLHSQVVLAFVIPVLKFFPDSLHVILTANIAEVCLNLVDINYIGNIGWIECPYCPRKFKTTKKTFANNLKNNHSESK